MDNEKAIGTNAYNCVYISKRDIPVGADELNDQRGIDPKTDDEMQTAKAVDLITLPDGSN